MRLKELINFIVMKKLLLLLLFISLVSFGQNDFRKMNWGESKEALKEKYPDVEFIPVFQSGADFLTHFDTVLGFTASVNYLFIDNKLVGGIYTFSPMAFVQTGDDKLKEYNLHDKKILLSPVYDVLDSKSLAEWILEDKLKVRLQIQLHKQIWPADTIGV